VRTPVRSLPAAAFILSLLLSIASFGVAFADNIVTDGDGVSPVNAGTVMSFGTVCANASPSKTALVAVIATGHPGAGTNVFANSAVVTVSVSGVSGTGFSASMGSPATIALPANWTALGNNTISASVSSSVGLDAGVAGLGVKSATVTYSATGDRSTGGTLTRTGTLAVSATVVNCDSTPPDTTISSGPAAFDSSSSTTFVFTGTDDTTSPGDLSFECSLDGGPFSSCSSPLTSPGLGEGAHSFDVRAADQAGNTDPIPAHHAWTVDTTAPDTTITSGPSSPNGSTSATFEFTGSDNITSAGDLAFQCSLDGGSFAGCTSPMSVNGLGAGSHSFDVRAVDQAGNPDPSPASAAWMVDVSPPKASITDGPDNLTSDTSASFSFAGSDDNTSAGDLAFECSLDGASFDPCSSPQDYASLAEGVHTFEVRATDEAGNVGDPASFSWTVDLTAPDTDISDAPSGYVNGGSGSVSFDGTDNVTAPGDLSFECSLDGGAFASCDSPVALSGLGDGPHTFDVRATDEAGNTDASPASASWIVDTTPPDTAVDSGPDDPTASTSASLGFSGSDNLSAEGDLSFECSLDGAAFAPCDSPVDYAGLAEGSHTFDVRATDQAGNVDPSQASFSWTVDLTAPAVTVIVPPVPSGQGGYFNAGDVPVTVSVVATDPSGVTDLQCTDGGDPVPVSGQSGSSPRTGSFDLSADGSHSITCQATDGVGNDGAEAGSANTATVDIDGSAPNAPSVEVTPTPNGAGWNNSTPVVVSFADNADVGPSGVAGCTEDAILTSETAGTDVAGACTDVAGNTGPSASVTVKIDITAPEITCGTPDGVWHAGDVSIACSAEDDLSGLADPAGDAGFLLWTDVPAGTEDANASTGTRTVADVAGNSSGAGPIDGNMVDKKGPAISIASPSAGPYTLLQTVAAAYGCTDGGSGLASCVGTVPNGASIDTSSVGAHTFTVNAADNVANPSTGSVTYNVRYSTGSCLGAAGHAVLQPVDADGSSVFKKGSTVPVKFRVCDALGHSIGTPGVVLGPPVNTSVTPGAGAVDENVFSTTPDTAFRWSASDQLWIFNQKTTNLISGKVYTFRIDLNDGTAIYYTFGVK
jgi:hypothetical protein